MQRSIGLLALAFSALCAPAFAAPAKCQIGKVGELPVTMRGSAPEVVAKAGDVEIPFIADSGAFYSLISPATVARLGLKPYAAPANFRLGGVGGTTKIELVRVKNFKLDRFELPSLEFIVGGENIFPGAVGGLIGQNILRAADVEYDLANGVIRILQPTGCGDLALAYWADQTSALKLEPTTPLDPHARGVVTVNGVRIHAIFDTGAQRSILSLKGAARAGVTPQSPGVVAVGVGGGIGPRVRENWAAPIDSFEIGGEVIQKTKLLIGDIALPDSEMLVGADFFLSHRVYVANSQRRLYFTYNGGPVFDIGGARRAAVAAAAAAPAPPIGASPPPAPEPAAGTPTDAAGFARRGAAFAARLDYPRALADYNRAAELEPDNPKHYLDRAIVRLRSGQPTLGLADLNEVLRLNPADPVALENRGELYLALEDEVRARQDFDRAIALQPGQPSSTLRKALAYMRHERFEPASLMLADWVVRNPKDARLAMALNSLCWSRAVLGRELETALANCNAALKLQPRLSAFLDSRALVELRLGRLDAAIADYDAAIRAQPKAAWSFYARGLAKQKKGDKAGGEADIAAAVALDPKTAEQARRYGLTS